MRTLIKFATPIFEFHFQSFHGALPINSWIKIQRVLVCIGCIVYKSEIFVGIIGGIVYKRVWFCV